MANAGITSGMDIAAVRALAAQMTSAANEIRTLQQQVTAKLQATPWAGPDQQKFEQDWTGTYATQLNNVISALEDASRVAGANATQQEQASNS